MKVVVYGAGAVGRGLIGRIFCNAGHYVAFVERQMEITRRLAVNGYYPLNTGDGLQWVGPVVAYMPDSEGNELLSADMIVCCVRVENMQDVAKTLRTSLPRRNGSNPQILVVENTPNADKKFADMVGVANADLLTWHGIAECVIPEVNPDLLLLDPALANGDAGGYLLLPNLLEPTLGEIPGIMYSDDFEFDWALKWYCHCAIHAVVAYVGLAWGFVYIDQVVSYPFFRGAFGSLKNQMRDALTARFADTVIDARTLIGLRLEREEEQMAHPKIRDTCGRVGRDASRKIQPGERLRDLEALVGEHPLVAKAIQEAERMAVK